MSSVWWHGAESCRKSDFPISCRFHGRPSHRPQFFLDSVKIVRLTTRFQGLIISPLCLRVFLSRHPSLSKLQKQRKRGSHAPGVPADWRCPRLCGGSCIGGGGRRTVVWRQSGRCDSGGSRAIRDGPSKAGMTWHLRWAGFFGGRACHTVLIAIALSLLSSPFYRRRCC